MALLYRGAGFGSYWHDTDARLTGFAPRSPGATPSNDRMIQHIAFGGTRSPYMSFTRSFGVARAYALVGPRGFSTQTRPGYVYEVEVLDDKMCKVMDPVKEIAAALPQPWQEPPYQHDGTQRFLLGVVDPVAMLEWLQEPCCFPRGGGTPRAANLSRELETLVRAMRDAELLVEGNIPACCVRTRHEVY